MDIDQKYQETLDYLYSYIDFSLQKASRYSPDRFDLGRMRDFMASLGDPQSEYSVIHIAGTKGKGSVAALCANALTKSGLRSGLYTSPHLQDYAERIQVDGVPIPHENLIDLVDEMKPNIADSPEITTFEITTALALLYFSRLNLPIEQIGLIVAVYGFSWGFLQLITGVLSDRIGRKPLIFMGMIISGLGISAIILVEGLVWWVIISSIIGGGMAMLYPTLLAVVGDVADPKWRATSLGVYRMWRDGGFGLFNIRERLEHIGGRATIESEPGHGTCVTVVAPVSADES